VIQYHGKESGKIHLTGEWHPSDEELLPITDEVMNMPPPSVINSDGSEFIPAEDDFMPPMWVPNQQPMMQPPME
jgi:hypothetical protein